MEKFKNITITVKMPDEGRCVADGTDVAIFVPLISGIRLNSSSGMANTTVVDDVWALEKLRPLAEVSSDLVLRIIENYVP